MFLVQVTYVNYLCIFFVIFTRNAFDGELFGLNPRDEIEMLLHIYCKHQSEAKPGM